MKADMLDDLSLMAIDAGIDVPPIQPGGEWNMLATGVANISSVLVANQEILDEDSDPLRATGAPLDEWRQRLQLPEVAASPAAGTVTITVLGTGNIPAGTGIQAPNGYVATVTTGATSVTGATTVDALMTTTGPDGNLPTGTRVRIVGGPPNLVTEATVPADWVGGKLSEGETSKRERVLNRIQNAGSNWGDLRDKALEASGAVGDAFVYRALGGPGSVKVVIVDNTSTITREVAASNVAIVQAYIDAAFPDGVWNVVVQSAVDNPADIALGLALPATGSRRWLASGPTDITTVSGTAYTSPTSFRLFGTLGALSAGDVIATFDESTQALMTARVLTVTSSDITTQPWSGGVGPVSGDLIFPACDDLQTVVDKWLEIMARLGPGENIAPADSRIAFSYRLPVATSEKPITLTTSQLLLLQQAIPEVTNISYVSLSVSTATPALASDAPFVVTQGRFGIYPI
jgi:uncharacterized phage protein gp47/JayE